MKAEPRAPEVRGLIRTALITLAVTAGIGVGVWWLGRCFSSAPATPADLMSGLAIAGMGAAAIWVVLMIWQGIHESRVIRRVVANALRGRAPLSNEEFAAASTIPPSPRSPHACAACWPNTWSAIWRG